MNILLSKTDALGDQILITGLVGAIRSAHPDSRLVWHVRSGMEYIADLLDDASIFRPDETKAADEEARRFLAEAATPIVLLPFPLNPYTQEWIPRLAERLQWWELFVRSLSWDVAVAPMVSRNWFSDFTVAVSGAPRRMGFAMNASCQPMLDPAASLLEERGIRDIYTKEATGRLDAPELASIQALAAQLLGGEPSCQPTLRRPPAEPVGKPLVLMAPGTGVDRKKAWPVSSFLELAESFPPDRYEVQWLCGPLDEEFFDRFPSAHRAAVLRYQPRDLARVAGRIAAAHCLVCNDTSVAHLAAALETPVLCVMGAGHGDRFQPVGPRVKIVQADLVCRGCQWNCLFDNYLCVLGLSEDEVRAALREMLEDGNFEPRRVPVDVGPLLPGGGDAAGRALRAFQDRLLSRTWDGWRRLQVIHELAGREAHHRQVMENARQLVLAKDREIAGLRRCLKNPMAFLAYVFRNLRERCFR
jgi:ADP-heptose:LPS heptosyltransferase